jgi:hypothetical protein
MSANRLYGLSAEFEQPEEMLAAAIKLREAGYTEIKAFSPYEVHGLNEVLEHRSPFLPWLVLLGLGLGALGAFAMMYWSSVVHYPLNVGGRPDFNLPAWTPIMFEAAILFAGLGAVGYMFIKTGLPVPYHPIFNAAGIRAASSSRFFLCVRVTDAKFSPEGTRNFLQSLKPVKVSDVPC